MVGEIAISNFEIYNTSMAKSLVDKIYFMDKLDEEVKYILDYGCADGTLVIFLAKIFPHLTFIGYDIDETMLELAQDKLKESGVTNVIFTNDFHSLNIDFSKCAVNLSSLIHEVYSYGCAESIEAFWHTVNETGFRYIVTRDMCLDKTAHRPSLKEDIAKVHAKFDEHKIADFEHIHGALSDNYNLIHFLLKYKYEENWEREVNENYLPLCVDEFMNHIGAQYELVYMDHYILPYLARTVKEDFGIVLKDYTHAKFIYKLI